MRFIGPVSKLGVRSSVLKECISHLCAFVRGEKRRETCRHRSRELIGQDERLGKFVPYLKMSEVRLTGQQTHPGIANEASTDYFTLNPKP